eukprot:9034791-Prorocentrum_lima.AAC.1
MSATVAAALVAVALDAAALAAAALVAAASVAAASIAAEQHIVVCTVVEIPWTQNEPAGTYQAASSAAVLVASLGLELVEPQDVVDAV